ncbi:MAG: hypothetical protein M3R22_12445 [Pseudomonadota bacterium]|nr:hypothetical protein [Pseudomonadota bacterium]
MRQRVLRRYERLLAGLLGLVWIGGGIAALVIGIARSGWAVIAMAVLAAGYGVVWLRVAARARLYEPGELLMPWRARK